MGKENAYPPDEFTARLFTDRLVKGEMWRDGQKLFPPAAEAAGVLMCRLESDLLTGFGLPGDIHGPGWLWCRSYYLGAVPDPLAKAAMKRTIDRGHLRHEPIYDERRGFTGSGFGTFCPDGRRVALEAALRGGWVSAGARIPQEDIDAALRSGDWMDTQPIMDCVKPEPVRESVELNCRELLRLVQEILIFRPSRQCARPDCSAGWTAREIAEVLDLIPAFRVYAPALLQSLMAWGMVRRERMAICPCGDPPKGRPFVHYAEPEEAWRRPPPEAA